MCNAWNHPSDCTCGWGGDGHLGISGTGVLNDYSDFKIDNDAKCNSTECPKCGAEVYFVKHNGGSVWLDPPLAPPWYKHPCFENMQSEESNGDLIGNYKAINIDRFKIPTILLSQKWLRSASAQPKVDDKNFVKAIRDISLFSLVKSVLVDEADPALFYAFLSRNSTACHAVYLAATVMMESRAEDYKAFFAAHGIKVSEKRVIINTPVSTPVIINGNNFNYSLAIPNGDFSFDKKHKDKNEREVAVLCFLNSNALTFKEFCLGVKKVKSVKKAAELALKNAMNADSLNVQKSREKSRVINNIKMLARVNMAEKVLEVFKSNDPIDFIENILPNLNGEEYSLLVDKLKRRIDEKEYEDFLLGLPKKY
jgi:hypothetical protein